jgi:hypothetical protein
MDEIAEALRLKADKSTTDGNIGAKAKYNDQLTYELYKIWIYTHIHKPY